MVGEYPLVCPGCFCVTPSPEDWCAAIERVTRPHQVQHLLTPTPAYALPRGYSSAGAVADYLRGEFHRGALAYIADPEGCDLWGPPHATLLRGGGDCDDLSALALSLLHAMGVNSDMIVGMSCHRGRCLGHAWVEGHDEGGYFVLEATSGRLLRVRPHTYRAHYQLRPGRCSDLRDRRTIHAARVLRQRAAAAQPRQWRAMELFAR